jgi:hypothetical protein
MKRRRVGISKKQFDAILKKAQKDMRSILTKALRADERQLKKTLRRK